MPVVRELFRTRTYQRPARAARRAGYKRFIKLWHRRAGKDRDAATFCLEEMLQRVGVYYHIFPALNQGRRDFWDNVIQEKTDGVERSVRMLEACFPRELVEHIDDKEMQLTLKGGSIYQIVGCDDRAAVERQRGPNPVGLIYSEYAHGAHMEYSWETLFPVLAENGGWAQFAYTPNGMNQGYKLWQSALADPATWFTQKLTVDDTRRDAVGEDGGPVVPLAVIEEARRNGRREEWIQQEFYCSFTAYQHGTIYGDLMIAADESGRVTDVPYLPNFPVGVLMDIGLSDAMALWFYQVVSGAIRFIDYYSIAQKDLRFAVQLLREQRPYIYGRIVLPWDARGGEEYLTQMGFRNVVQNKRTGSVQTSIDAVRRDFSRFYFDRTKCAVRHNDLPSGLESLRNYKREWDEEKRVFSVKPQHDEFSHGADALRAGVEGGFEPLINSIDMRPVRVEIDFDPRTYGVSNAPR